MFNPVEASPSENTAIAPVGLGAFDDGDFPFPYDAFPPSAFRDLASSVSGALPVPPELPYLIALSVVGALAGRRVVASNKWSGFKTPPNMFWIVAAPTTAGKSIAMKPFSPALKALESEVQLEWESTAGRLRAERALIFREGKARAKGSAGGSGQGESNPESGPQGDRLAEIERILAEGPPKWIEGAPTPEALVNSMATWGECGFLFTSEGEPAVRIFEGKYSKGATAFGTLCALFSGDAVGGSRIGRKAKSLTNPRLSAFFCVQPDVALSLRVNDEARQRGLAGRWLWVKAGENRPIDPEIPSQGVPALYCEAYAKACRELFDAFCRPSQEVPEVQVVIEDSAARYLYRRFAEDQRRAREGRGDAELYTRSVELITRIALALHLMQHRACAGSEEISMFTVQNAERLYQWTLQPWLADDEDDVMDSDSEAMKKIEEELEGSMEGMTVREIYRLLRIPPAKAKAFVMRMVAAEKLHELEGDPGSRTIRYHCWNPR